MRKLLLLLVALFALCGTAFAAVDLNTADMKALESVKGIGPVKAKAIIDYRTKNGPFKSAEDLDKVKGFGAKTINKIAPEVTIGGQPLKTLAVDAKDAKGGKKADAPAAAAAPAAADKPAADDKKAKGGKKSKDAKADAKPADAKPADAKPADAKPADAKPADAKPAMEKK